MTEAEGHGKFHMVGHRNLAVWVVRGKTTSVKEQVRTDESSQNKTVVE